MKIKNNNIAEIRKSLRMTQFELANKLGINQTYLSTLENKKEINGITLHKIAKVLNTTEKRIFDFSDRSRTKPSFNPHMEAFWTQGCQAREYLSKEERIKYIDIQLGQIDKETAISSSVINRIMNLGRFIVYCLLDYIDDTHTKEKITDLELLFAAALAGADFFLCVAIMENRIDIIQSFINGLTGTKETRNKEREVNNTKTIREQEGISRLELARVSHVPLQTIKLIESKNQCSDTHLPNAKRIAKHLNCEFTDLFYPIHKDIYNIQAKAAGKNFKKADNVTELVEALKCHRDSVELSVRDIVAFLNTIQRKTILKTG